MAGPGKDNITGDRYTLDLGVEPDLGNLLQNLTVANKLLDEAENKFRAISTVVGSTTQRVNELTRATQLFVTQTQRIRNEYQGIADASSRIGDLGGGGGGGVYGPGMGLIGAGMSPSVTNQLIAQSMRGEPGQREENDPIRLKAPREKPMNWSNANLMARIKEDLLFGGRHEEGPTPTVPWGSSNRGATRTDPYGSQSRRQNEDNETLQALLKIGQEGAEDGSGGGWLSKALLASRFMKPNVVGTGISKILSGPIGGALESVGMGGMVAGGLKFAPVIGNAVMIATLAKKALDIGYNVAANTARKAQEYTELTGGTSIAQRTPGQMWFNPTFRSQAGLTPFDGLRGEELRAAGIGEGWLGGIGAYLGYEDPLFSKEQSREAMGIALGAGYQQEGLRRKDLFGFLKTTTVRGFGDMASNLDLYEEAVDKAGGSTASLTSAIDRLKTVAQRSDVSIQRLAKNFGKQIEILTGYGLGGTNAAAFATTSVTAYANAQTPAVRNSMGPDLANPYMRAGMANYFGVSYGAVPGALSGAFVNVNGQQVATTTAMANYSDARVASVLQGMGFKPGMEPQEIMNRVSLYSGALAAMGVLPSDIDPNDYPSVRDWIMRYTGGTKQTGKGYKTPMGDNNAERLEGAKATTLSNERFNLQRGLQLGAAGAIAGTAVGPKGSLIGGVGGFLAGTLGNNYQQLTEADVDYSVSMFGLGGDVDLKDRKKFDYKDNSMTAQATTVEQWYERQLNQDRALFSGNAKVGEDGWLDWGSEGAMNMPIMNQLLGMNDRDLRNVYVDLGDGKKVNLANAMSGQTNVDLTEADKKKLLAGLRGEQELGYAVKDNEGNITEWSTLSNLKIDNAERQKEDDKVKKDGQTEATATWVRVANAGVPGVGGGQIGP